MSWTWLVVQLLPDDQLAIPQYGPDFADHAAAHRVAGGLLVTMGAPRQVRDQWARRAKDDTVYFGTTTVALVEYPAGDADSAVSTWLSDYAATMRGAGLDVTIGTRRKDAR
jgi:hypothetical protein